MKSRRVAIAGLVLAATLGGYGAAMGEDIDLTALTQETQRMSQKPDAMTMVWWIPEEFWSASLSQNPSVTAEQTEEFLRVIRPYTMVVVVDGTMGAFGGVTYKPEEYIRANTYLLDAQGKSYPPRTEAEIDPDTKNMLLMMKPVFINMLGPMGQNMHFLLFPGKTATGVQIANARNKGQFKVKLADKEFKWRLPLDSLLPLQICGKCKQESKGSWSFCPWCGASLAKGTQKPVAPPAPVATPAQPGSASKP